MSATNTFSVINLHARRTREADINCAPNRARRKSRRDDFQLPTRQWRNAGIDHQGPINRSGVFDKTAPFPEPDIGEKWPIWKSATFLIVYCSLAWGFIGTRPLAFAALMMRESTIF